MRPAKNLILIVFCCLLGAPGCNLIYKQNVQQGNAIEQEKLDQLKLGMTMNQVAFLLGTPAIRDPFHQSRWDYVYSYARRGGDATIRKVTLRFENAILQQMTGTDPDDFEKTFAATEATQPEPTLAPREVESVIPAINTPTEGASEPDAVAAEPAPEPEPESEPEPQAEAMESPESPATSEHADVRPAASVTDAWLVQIGAFDDLQNARNLVRRLNSAGFSVSLFSQQLSDMDTRYLVRSEGFASKTEAERQLQQIQQAFELDGFLVPPSD